MELRCSRLRSHLLLGAFLILGVTCCLPAQTARGILRGQVTDSSGALVAGASIVVTGPAGQTVTSKTGSDGTYEVRNLAPGKYTIRVAATGFASYQNETVQINGGETRTLNVVLSIQAQQQQVIVSAESLNVDVSPSNNANSVVITGKDLDALPDDPDELQSDLQALAGPAAGPSGGQMYIDGFTAGQLPPKSAIREVRVNQNPFSAEYDKPGYGRIEVFTKPGSDQWHGEFSVNGNDSVFNSGSPFVAHAPGYDSKQFNGFVGGPLSKKASFFFNVDSRQINDTSIVDAYTSLNSSNQPVSFSDAIPNPRTRLNINPRLDYQLSKNNTLSIRYQFYRDDAVNEGIGGLTLESQGFTSLSSEQTVQIRDIQTIGSKMINETRFQFLRDDTSQSPLNGPFHVTQCPQNAQGTLGTLEVLGALQDCGNNPGSEIDHTNHFELQNYTSTTRGNHSIIFGGRLRIVTDSNYSTSGLNGTFVFPSLTALQAGSPSQFTITTASPLADISMTDGSLYAEDDWRIRKNVTVSYGLRFETQNHIHDHADWAPRLGISWGLGSAKAAPKTVLRVGFGVFYDRFTSDLLLQAARLNGSVVNGVVQGEYVVPNPSFYPLVPTPGSANLTFPSFYQLSPTLHAPYSVQVGASAERQVTKAVKVSLSYLNTGGFDQLITNNVNAPLPGTYTPGNVTSGTRPNGVLENIYQFQSDANYHQNQFIMSVNVRASGMFSLNGYYSLNDANSDTAGPTSFPSDPYNLFADYGRASFAVRNRLFLAGTIALPQAVSVSPFMLITSGTPYNVSIGQDLNGSSVLNQRPAFCTQPSSGNCVETPYGDFNPDPVTNPADGTAIVPINYLTGPAHFTLNLRVTKTISFGGRSGDRAGAARAQQGGNSRGGAGGSGGNAGGKGRGRNAGDARYNLAFSVNARNVFNYVNLDTPIGNIGSPLFGKSNGLVGGPFSTQAADRIIYLQTTFRF